MKEEVYDWAKRMEESSTNIKGRKCKNNNPLSRNRAGDLSVRVSGSLSSRMRSVQLQPNAITNYAIKG